MLTGTECLALAVEADYPQHGATRLAKKTTSMGSGRGGGNEETWGRDQEHGQEISLGNQSQRYAEGQDFQQRRAGQRFHYRRRTRWKRSEIWSQPVVRLRVLFSPL